MKYIIGAYTHLTQGNSQEEFKKVLNSQLKPLLTLAFSNPDFRFILRISIFFIQWLETSYPEINMLISDLCRKGQLELLGSSYYDSLLQLEPVHERPSRIEKTNTFIRKKFSRRPRGMWCIGQVFNPAFVQAMELSSLEYLVISGYNQQLNQVLINKPFIMDELGKQTVIFPYEDKVSKDVSELVKPDADCNRFVSSVMKTISSQTAVLNTYMFNLDQMCLCEDSAILFNSLIPYVAGNSVLPSEFIAGHEITNNYYLPSGIYGRDFSLGNAVTINEHIIEQRVLSRNQFLLNSFREAAKGLKRNTDDKKFFDHLLMKAGFGLVYLPPFDQTPGVLSVEQKAMGELEANLAQKDLLPSAIGSEVISKNKNYICYINSKGAVISRLNIFSLQTDFALTPALGFFQDFIRNGKTSELGSRKWELGSIDKKHHDYVAESPVIEVNKIPVQIIKTFKTRQNYISVDYEIVNKGNSSVEFVFETVHNFNLNSPDELKDTEEPFNTSQFVFFNSFDKILVTLGFSEEFGTSIRNFSQKVMTVLGERDYYQYTQMRFQKKIFIPASESVKFTAFIKSEKKRNTGDNI